MVLTLTSVFRAGALAATSVVLGLAPLASTPALAVETQVQQTETTPDTPNGKAPMPSPMLVPVTLPTTSAARTDTARTDTARTDTCTPTTSLLRFDGGYEVSMCYRTPDGVAGQAKAGLYASAESGLLWFFSRDNAEVLVKVLNGCSINGHRWVFVAPVTTLEFSLRVTSPTGKRWTHGNRQGVTAAAKSDVAAFACADEPEAADSIVSGVAVSDAIPDVGQNVAFRSTAPNALNRGDGDSSAAAPNGREGSASKTSWRYYSSPDEAIEASDAFIASDGVATPTPAVLAVGPQTETTPDTPNGKALMPTPSTSPTTPGCTPTTSLLRFDGGYEVSMCYRTSGGLVGQAKAGLYASAESGLLRFFSPDNAEVLVKVLNGCSINGHRWVFVAPVTTLEFDLRVTSPTGERWTHTNTQGVTAATKSDLSAFGCAEEPEAAPDLIVSDVSVSDAAPAPGQTITFRATVRNRGHGPATPTTLRFYRSSDSTISASDNSDDFVFGAAVPALSASGTESTTLDFRAPSTPGTFYFGACIDSVSGESRTGNNCSAGVRVVVDDEPDEPDEPDDEPGAAPDLIVSRISVSDASPVVGQTITLRATVRNRGGGPATPATLRFHRSDDSTISTSDYQLDSEEVGALAASATESRTLDAVFVTHGTYYFGACIDSVSEESRTGNNCSHGVRVVVRELAPDLLVSHVSVTDENPVTDDVIELRATVQNRGDGSATPTTLRFYRSDDSTISAADIELGSQAVATLSASATESRTFQFAVPSTPATFYLGACVGSVSAESDAGNNCSTGAHVVVREPAPDLLVSHVSVTDASPVHGDALTLGVTVQNQGEATSSTTILRFYWSNDSTISTADNEIGSGFVAELAASATQSNTHDLTVPSTASTFYLGACIDSASDESDAGNNCSISVRVVVRPPAPDLIVSDVSMSNANPVTGTFVVLQATVRNQGEAASSTTTLRFYRSDDLTINTADDLISSKAVPTIAASATQSSTLDFTVPSTAGTYYIGACIDSASDESDKGNNCSDAARVVVRDPAPDLIVSDVSVSNANPVTKQLIEARATVRNQGVDPALQTTLRYYRSDDSLISRDDVELGDEAVAELAVSATQSGTLDFAAPLIAGMYYIGACIDVLFGEPDTGNNCSDGVPVNVEAREPGPDLVVSAALNNANPAPNEFFLFAATVRNRGDGPASRTQLTIYRSSDSTISRSDRELIGTWVGGLAVSASWYVLHNFSSPNPATYYLGACVASVSDEFDKDNNCSDGVRVVVE